MQAVLTVTLPIFGLVLAGFGAARWGLLGAASSEAINRFVYYFALPALLFLTVLRADLAALADLHFLVSFLGGMMASAALLALLARRALGESTVLGMTACYANVGYMGVPLGTMAFGPDVLPLIVVAMVVTASLTFAIGVGLMEWERGTARALAILRRLLLNPLLLAPALGLAVSVTGLPVPAAAVKFVELLAQAASPCALFALGLFLAAQPVREELGMLGLLVGLKLIVQPAATWAIAVLIGADPRVLAIVVLLNALPTGTGAFVLAQQYGVAVRAASAATLVGTALAVLTISALLLLLRP